MGVLDFLNPLNAITGALTRAYEAKLAAANDSERIAAEIQIAQLETKRDVLIALVGEPWWTPRNLMAYCVTILVFKLVVWDSALGWGVTDDVGSLVTWIVVTIIGFFFLSKSADAITAAIAGRVARK